MSSKNRKRLFFTSDLHFGHRNILKHCPNRCDYIDSYHNNTADAIKQHDEVIIKRWNSLVKDCDTVVVLGDVKLCANAYGRECISRLNGKKILVKGNHDESNTKMINYGFDWACDQMMLNIGGNPVLLSHYPYKPPKWKIVWLRFKQLFSKKTLVALKHLKQKPYNRGLFLLHGHTHQSKKNIGRMIHVGLDSWNMFPVSEDMILSYIDSIKKQERKK